MSYTQKNRPLKIKTPLGNDVLMLSSMSGIEELGKLSVFNLNLVSRDDQINPEDLLGQSMTVEMELANGKSRYFNGIVGSFGQDGESGEFFQYKAILHPWLWFLQHTTNCRIFQDKTVPDIIKEVFRANGFSDFSESLSGTYRTWEYCVQYRETDFNFISRLMEQEGIYYFFTHEDGKHTLQLSDSISSHEPIAIPNVPYYPPSHNVERYEDYIDKWGNNRNLQSGAYSQRDFDFKKPKANLETKLTNPFNHDKSDYEIYDYPGEYVSADEGNQYTRTRLEEVQAKHERMNGEGNVHGLYAGSLFNLTGYPREDQNQEYLVVAIQYQLQSDALESGNKDEEEGDLYSCDFEVIKSEIAFRTTRSSTRPTVQGSQTAMVVGPEGEEIYTDKFGRVKVQFHWDRYGEQNENSSCWVRVSHPWAGKNWGAISLPRISQEVIVSFLEGDPDRPIITGRFYNADSMPPYDLPANATQSGIKTRSSKGGTGENFNELRFEDKKGHEEIYIHAEKDQNNVVENNDSTKVGGNQTELIKKNKAESILIAKALSVGAGYQVSVGASKNETVGLSSTEQVGVLRQTIVGKRYEIVCGKTRLVMNADGTILIEGDKIAINGSTQVQLNGKIVNVN